MMKYIFALVFFLVASIAEAACPVGSTCENYQGQIPYPATNPTSSSSRAPSDRANDHGLNILDFGAHRNDVVNDSSVAIQSAIDTCYNTTGCANIFCPDGQYVIKQSLFFDPPNSLRGGAAWHAGSSYFAGDIVIQSGTYYRAKNFINGAGSPPPPPTADWTTSPAPIYSGGATYSANDTVISSGIMWKSNIDSNTGNTPSNGGTAWSQTVEQGNINPNWNASFTGDHSSGCNIFVQYGNFPAMWVFGNGMEVERVKFQNNATGLTRCQNVPTNIGFALAGGGSSLTTLREVQTLNFYAGLQTTANLVDNVNDSNYMERSDFQNSCFGIWFTGTQSFLNNVTETRSTNARYNLRASANNGASVWGGNYTTGNTAYNTFTMGSVTLDLTASPSPRLTATLSSNAAGTWPDTNLTNSQCSGTNDATFTATIGSNQMVVSAVASGTISTNDWVTGNNVQATFPSTYYIGGQFQVTGFVSGTPGGVGTYNISSAQTIGAGQTFHSTKRIDYPLSCQYDVLVVQTAAFGNVPFKLSSVSYGGINYSGNFFNNNTNVITAQLDQTWIQAQISNANIGSALKADVEAQTVLYASEVATTFWTCGDYIQGVHIENAQGVTTFANSFCTFGARASYLNNIYINYEVDQQNWATQIPPIAIAQDVTPAIVQGNDLHINGIDLGGQPLDRVTVVMNPIQQFTWKNGILPLNVRAYKLCSSSTFSGTGSGVNFAGCGYGSTGIGFGSFDNGGPSVNSLEGTGADQWRGGVTSFLTGGYDSQPGPGTSEFIGRRPAPWANPCVSSAQLGNYLGSLPAITITSGAAKFDGVISSNVLTVTNIVGGNNLVAGQKIYGNGMLQVTLGTLISGTAGGNGTWNVSSVGDVTARKMSTAQYDIPYPTLWGGQNYRVCDVLPWTRNNTVTNSFYSNHKFYSWGVNLDTSINPGLAWTLKQGSNAVYLDPLTLRMVHPGMIMQLQCNNSTKDLIIAEVHQTGGYVFIIDGDQDGSPYVPNFGQDCTGTGGGGGVGTANLTIKQPAYSIGQF